MVTQKIKELEATKAKIASLEKSIASQISKELAALPRKYGFASLLAFTKAVKAAFGPSRSGGKRRKKKAGRPAGRKDSRKKGGAKRRRRAVITDATRAEVKRLVEAGKTGGEIAKSLKISLPSVQNIKKALGLIKPRG